MAAKRRSRLRGGSAVFLPEVANGRLDRIGAGSMAGESVSTGPWSDAVPFAV